MFDPSTPQDSHSSTSEPSSTPAPAGSEAKPVKKRKSWGQVLPEPKTSLPPRKRAKTEDEKEQRRIERVKRNRLAAHNSRERKRQEYELLQAEKDQMEADLQSFKQKMARMEAELKFYRQKYPGEAPDNVFDLSTTASNDTYDTICPAQTSTSFPSPISMDSMDSPRDSSCQPETPPSTFEATPEFDSTQYPAAILCDLQCRSTSGTASPSVAAIWAYLTLFNLTLQSTKSLSSTVFSTLTSSPKAAHQLLRWNPLLAWLILLPSTSSDQPSSVTALSRTFMAFLTALMQSSLTCRVPLAQLWLATRLSQRSSSIEDITARSGEVTDGSGPVDGVLESRLMRSFQLRQSGRRKGVPSLRGPMVSLGRENLGCDLMRRRKES